MLDAFIIVLREGFEGFLIVAIILSFLRKTGGKWLEPAVYWGIFVSLIISGISGYLLRDGVNQSLWEGVLGLITMLMVGTLVIQMMRVGSRMKKEIENNLSRISDNKSKTVTYWAVFLFTVLNITREGMETAVMLIQIQDSKFILGALLGVGAAMLLSYAWTRFSYLINLKRFFQVTSIFLLLFLVQVGIYSIHEFSEAGILPNSEFIHGATEQISPDGFYGKWFSLLIVFACFLWLGYGWFADRLGQLVKKQAVS